MGGSMISNICPMKRTGQLAQSDIAAHSARKVTTAALVLAACRAYYLSKNSDLDAEGYRAVMEGYLGFPQPVREEWTIDDWDVFLASRQMQSAVAAGKHDPIFT
jgi:hypothetical protein